MVSENREMIESFTLISQELSNLAENLKESEMERERLKQEQKEMDDNLAACKAEALAAKAAAAAAEEAKRASELAAKALKEITITTQIHKVEITQVNSVSSNDRYSSPPKKLKTDDGKPPDFVVPLRDATVREGEKFEFKCKVSGQPTPEIMWLKDGMAVESNPDYQTEFNTEENTCSLKIDETFAEDTATFTCKAINSFGSAETSALLTVAGTLKRKEKFLFV